MGPCVCNEPSLHPETSPAPGSCIADWRVLTLVRQIRERKENVQLTLKQVKQEAQIPLSVDRLARRFKQCVGMRFREFLRSVRLTVAAELLVCDPSLGLKEVADRLGYSECGNFLKDFRRFHGVTPNEYRKSALLKTCCTPNRSSDSESGMV